MPDIKLAYGTTTSFTFTNLNASGPANGSSETSTNTRSNTTDLYLDDLIEVVIVSGGSGVVTTGTVEVWVSASIDNSDFADDTNDTRIGVLSVALVSTTYKAIYSVSSAFGGVLPPYYKVRIKNASGGAFGVGSSVSYRGVYNTVV